MWSSDGEWLQIQMKLLSLACCLSAVAWFLTGHGPVAICGLGLETPDLLHELKPLSHWRWQLNLVNSV